MGSPYSRTSFSVLFEPYNRPVGRGPVAASAFTSMGTGCVEGLWEPQLGFGQGVLAPGTGTDPQQAVLPRQHLGPAIGS